MSLKKVCLVIPSLHSGGMERVMSELAGYFCQQHDTEIHLVMYGMKPETFYSLPQNLVIHQPDWQFDDKNRKWNTLKRMIYLRRTIKKINPISILSFGEYWNTFVLLATIGTKIPVYISDRCQPYKSFGKLHKFLRTILYPKAKGIIAQTEVAKSIYNRLFKNKNIIVISNPIRSIISNDRIQRENIVLSVGRLIKTKHHDELIRIFAEINMPDWKLVIVGDDAIKQQNKVKLEKMINNLSMTGKIILAGNCSNVDDYYLNSKIFAFTSSSEGFPNVIGEAMSAGLPVIAYDCVAGPSEMIINNYNGLLIPLYDKMIFKQKLNSLMLDSNLRDNLGQNASFHIQKFSTGIIGEKFYQEITIGK